MRSHVIFVSACFLAISAATAQTLVVGGALPAGFFYPVGDVDADGRTDSVYLSPTGGGYEVRSGANGALLPALTRPTGSGNGTAYVPVGDVDADGHDDLGYSFVSFTLPSYVEIVSGASGSSLYTWPMPTASGFHIPFAECGADFDADGFSDVALKIHTSSSYTIEVRSGRTAATIFQQSLQATGSYELLALGDFNGDGYDDLGLEDDSSGPAAAPMTGLRGPTFASQPLGLFVHPFGDTNRNGTSDFLRLVASGAGYEIVDGTGALRLALGFVGSALPLGDLNGDGCADILRRTPQANFVISGLTLGSLPGASPTNDVSPIGDIDGDGRSEAHYFPGDLVYEWSDPAVPIASRMIRRGVGGTTSTGRRPRIKTRGHAGLGNTIFFDLRGAMPNGVTVMAIGPAVDVDLAPLGAAGNRAYMDPQSVFAMTTDGNGLARCQVTMPTTTSLLGAATTAQCLVLDPAANALGIVTSDAVDIETRN